MKINSYCFQKNELWYFRKKIPFLLNKKTPIYRVSLKKLLGKKSYYVSLLNASLFTITNYINNQVELLFLEVESLSLEELNDYVIELLQKYEQKAIIRDNNYVGDIGKEVKEIERLRFNALSYFDDKGTQFGGHTKIALQKELDELRLAYDTDNVGLYRKKARDILNRQNIITQEEISKIPENMILTFEENLVKKEMEVIIQDISNYDNLLNKKNVVNASSDLIAFLESNPALNKLLGDMNKSLSNQDHWDLLIDKFINGQKQKGRATRTAEIALLQFSQIMLGDEQLDIPKRNLTEVNLDDINFIKESYKNFPNLTDKTLKEMWREKGILYTIAFTSSEKNPAIGKDFMGITWSGLFTTNSSSCSATDLTGKVTYPTMVDSIANGGRVWSFEESLFEDHFANYNKNINATINIKKNTMTGNGNTAEAVLKYIHTYQKTTGSVSMNVGSDSVSAGFTLSNVKNQWSLVCNITGIYY